jgi:hypothetical protein
LQRVINPFFFSRRLEILNDLRLIGEIIADNLKENRMGRNKL